MLSDDVRRAIRTILARVCREWAIRRTDLTKGIVSLHSPVDTVVRAAMMQLVRDGVLRYTRGYVVLANVMLEYRDVVKTMGY